MFLFKVSSETGLFRHLPNHVFGVRDFGNTKSMRGSFFSECSKFNLDIENGEKNSENLFCFWDNSICIGIVKLSLLRTWYLSSEENVLTCKRHFFQLKCLGSYQLMW